MSLNDGAGLDNNSAATSSPINTGTGLWVQHQATLCDSDWDTLGSVTTIGTFTSRNHGPRPGLWTVQVRPQGVPTDQIWQYPKIGSAETVNDGLELLHRHITGDPKP